MLACANMGLEDTNSSQFLITLAPTHQLYGQHTCFGKVLAGFGVVKEVQQQTKMLSIEMVLNVFAV